MLKLTCLISVLYIISIMNCCAASYTVGPYTHKKYQVISTVAGATGSTGPGVGVTGATGAVGATGAGSTGATGAVGPTGPGASALRGYVVYNQATATILKSYNVASVTDTSTGKFKIFWDVDLADANYAVTCTPGTTAAVANYANCTVYTDDCTPDVGSVCLRVADFAGSLFDSNRISVVVFGD